MNYVNSGDIFERLVISEMDYLTQALETVDRVALNQAVELLKPENGFLFSVLDPPFL